MENSDKNKALESALGQIERTYGSGSIMRLGDDTIVDIEAISTGSIGLDIALGIGGLPKGRVVEIRTFDETGRRRTRPLFTEAYPIGIAPISLSWADDNIIRLNVTFAYRDYRTDFTPGEANPDAKPAGPSISGSIKIGNATIGGNIPLPSSPPSVSDVTVRPLPADDIIRRRL